MTLYPWKNPFLSSIQFYPDLSVNPTLFIKSAPDFLPKSNTINFSLTKLETIKYPEKPVFCRFRHLKPFIKQIFRNL